jgi:hypothetical protein
MNEHEMKKILNQCRENIQEVSHNHPEVSGKFWVLLTIDRALNSMLTAKDFEKKVKDGFEENHPNL